MAKSDRSSVFVADNMGISDADSEVNEKIEEQDREPLTRQVSKNLSPLALSQSDPNHSFLIICKPDLQFYYAQLGTVD